MISSTRSGRRAALKDFVSRHAADVDHVRQRTTWDCGLACLEMALRARGIEQGTSSSELRRLCASDSVWTIDLAYILCHFGVDMTFLTRTMGARSEYGDQPFYRKQFPEDEIRVTNLFRQSSKRGVKVVERSVRLAEIIGAVQERMLVLVLLDKRLLCCQLCEGKPISVDGHRSSFLPSERFIGTAFLGHYTLLYAYDGQTDSFLMKDPANHRDTCVIESATLESARSAFGTDEDIIFIGQREDASTVS